VPRELFKSLGADVVFRIVDSALRFDDHFAMAGGFEICADWVERDARFTELGDRIVSKVRIISDGWIEFVRPRVDDRVLIEVVHCSDDAILEFLFGCHTDVAQDGSRELGKEALDKIEPRAVLRLSKHWE
jgi:hypothetical protein